MFMFCVVCGAAGGPRWEPESPRRSISTTQKIRSIGREARVNQLISERLKYWKAHMRERGEQTSFSIQVFWLECVLYQCPMARTAC